jgi:hypothetical protein
MTETNGFNETFEKYIDGWADMMLTIWKERMEAYGIGDTGALENSLRTEVYRQSGGNAAKISHFFNYYGNYVARGVGREMGINGSLGKTRNRKGEFEEHPGRKAKPWLNGKYWYSKRKLLSEMMNQTGRIYLESIADILRSQT